MGLGCLVWVRQHHGPRRPSSGQRGQVQGCMKRDASNPISDPNNVASLTRLIMWWWGPAELWPFPRVGHSHMPRQSAWLDTRQEATGLYVVGLHSRLHELPAFYIPNMILRSLTSPNYNAQPLLVLEKKKRLIFSSLIIGTSIHFGKKFVNNT